MGSIGAMSQGSSDRYFQEMELSETETKLLHQGIENQGTFSQKQIDGFLTQLESGVSIPPQFMDFQFGLRMVF